MRPGKQLFFASLDTYYNNGTCDKPPIGRNLSSIVPKYGSVYYRTHCLSTKQQSGGLLTHTRPRRTRGVSGDWITASEPLQGAWHWRTYLALVVQPHNMVYMVGFCFVLFCSTGEMKITHELSFLRKLWQHGISRITWVLPFPCREQSSARLQTCRNGTPCLFHSYQLFSFSSLLCSTATAIASAKDQIQFPT